MRIHYLVAAPGVPARGPSGASAHVRGLVGGWRASGHAVDLFAACDVDRRGAVEEDPGAVLGGLPGWPSWLGRWRELREVIAARRVTRLAWEAAGRAPPDLIVERHSLFSDAGWRLADRLGCPFVLEVNAPPVEERSRYEVLLQRNMAERWQRDVLRAAPVLIAVSDWLVRWLREEIGCKQVQRVWNGVEPHTGDRALGRAILGLGPDEPVLGFVGSGRPWHGVARLGKVAAACGARLALLGPRPADTEGLPADAILTGPLSPAHLAHAVAALDLGLAPYPADAPPWFCPLKVLDYRAQGTPVVGSDLGETAALIGDAGVAVPAGDDGALIDAARRWLGRRTQPWIRSWSQVGEEVIAAAQEAG